ncbi:MAG TPA: hypothetical protein VFW39_05485 [Sphingomicrobium sp.]|nr:hypothetical protein [Sphingomicrobium sp.]
MRKMIAAALALTVPALLHAQQAPALSDLSYEKPMAGAWTYSPTSDGSLATFVDAQSQPQVTIHCTRATRRVTISKPVAATSPFLWIWTSAETKSVPAIYDAANARVTAEFAPFDPMLDAIASSRGRIGFSTSGLAATIVPPWGEVGRVIEDCRV